jgi:hypothetical protein
MKKARCKKHETSFFSDIVFVEIQHPLLFNILSSCSTTTMNFIDCKAETQYVEEKKDGKYLK